MNYDNLNLGIQGTSAGQQLCSPVNESLRQRLERQKKDAKERLENIEAALKFIDNNPGFEDFHNLIGKVY